jgi:hypothetical protein
MSGVSLTTKWNPAGAGCQLAYLTRSDEETPFFGEVTDKDTKSQWNQAYDKITWHANAIMIYPYTNSGAGRTQNADISRTPDFMGKCWDLTSWVGLKPNYDQGVKQSHYVNARGVFHMANLSVKVGSQPLFEIDPIRMLMIMDLLGLTSHYKELIGLHYNVQSLIEDSQKPTITITPFVGFPFQVHPQQALNVGTFAAHKLTACKVTQPLTKLVVNEVIGKGRGSFYMPFNMATDQVVQPDDIQSVMAAECYWVTKAERSIITGGYREVFYKEWKVVGQQTFEATSKPKEVFVDVDCKGLVHQVFAIVQSQDDLDKLNWTKCCDDKGQDYIQDIMLVTADKPREDGLPAVYYRRARISEYFKTKQNRHIYCIFNADTNPLNVTQITGGQGMTDISKIKVAMTVLPTSKALTVTIVSAEQNAFYTEKTSGFRVWG